jgi:hypothetical protein
MSVQQQVLFLYHDPCTDGFMCRVIAHYYYNKVRPDRGACVGVKRRRINTNDYFPTGFAIFSRAQQ